VIHFGTLYVTLFLSLQIVNVLFHYMINQGILTKKRKGKKCVSLVFLTNQRLPYCFIVMELLSLYDRQNIKL
jgi:hypothetical protein